MTNKNIRKKYFSHKKAVKLFLFMIVPILLMAEKCGFSTPIACNGSYINRSIADSATILIDSGYSSLPACVMYYGGSNPALAKVTAHIKIDHTNTLSAKMSSSLNNCRDSSTISPGSVSLFLIDGSCYAYRRGNYYVLGKIDYKGVVISNRVIKAIPKPTN